MVVISTWRVRSGTDETNIRVTWCVEDSKQYVNTIGKVKFVFHKINNRNSFPLKTMLIIFSKHVLWVSCFIPYTNRVEISNSQSHISLWDDDIEKTCQWLVLEDSKAVFLIPSFTEHRIVYYWFPFTSELISLMSWMKWDVFRPKLPLPSPVCVLPLLGHTVTQ